MNKGICNGQTTDEPMPRRLPKLCGADIELGNFILGLERNLGTGAEASRALLREIDGRARIERDRTEESEFEFSRRQHGISRGYGTAALRYGGGFDGGGGAAHDNSSKPDPQDWGRKFLPANGGCAYIDLDHLELCLPEVISAYDHAACWHAMLMVARRALQAANEKLPTGQKIQVLVNNSDGQGNSYGSHLNFLITRRAWQNIFERKIHYLLYLAAYQVSSIVFTGQGKVGSENGAPAIAFQLSQRGDFFETLAGTQTTFRRPLVNSRDEPLCGKSWNARSRAMARLHVIFFDNTLSQVACLLKVGVMQIVLAMIEAEQVNPDLILEDPLDAVLRWGHDPTLRTRVPLVSGKKVTAVELQMLFLEDVRRFAAGHGFEGIVPRADEIIALWEDTLLKLKAGELQALAPRLDWVLKFSILTRVLDRSPDLTWDSPQIKHLDHIYSSLDPDEGLYWAYEQSGFVQRIVRPKRIRYFVHNPPSDTRAWTRAMLMRLADAGAVECSDWDTIRLKTKGHVFWSTWRTVHLDDPLGFTRAYSRPIFRRARRQSGGALDALVDAL